MQEVMISADEKISYCKSCMPANGYKKKIYKVTPAEMQAYLSSINRASENIPAHNPGCEKLFREGAPMILSPGNQAEYLLSKKRPEPLALSCNAGNDVSKVYWYINNQFYKSASTNSKQFFVPQEGATKISCTDDKGRNRDIWITVRYVDL